MQHTSLTDKPFRALQEIDLVALCPDNVDSADKIFAATRESITRVFQDFLTKNKITYDRISVIDGFLFVFNEPSFANWETLNWWDQRRRILEIKDLQIYIERAQTLLKQSYMAPYMEYSDDMVAKSTDQEVKRAWMRKRLVLKECFWNAIDSFSHAAYFQKKYHELCPALCVLLCNVIDKNGKEAEVVMGIDNGIGFLYKKKSRDSAMVRFFYKMYKFFFRNGVFYIGGLELGLLETESKLSCHGSGAVVHQGW